MGQVLLIQPWIHGPVTVSAITGISGLYVALEVSLHIASLVLLIINWISPKRVLPRTPNLLGPTRNTSGSSERLGLARRSTSKSLRGLNIVLVDTALSLNPANGADLYWFDEFSSQIGNHVSGSKIPC